MSTILMLVFAELSSPFVPVYSDASFSIVTKHAIDKGRYPGTAFLDGVGTIRIESKRLTNRVERSYYCGQVPEPNIIANESRDSLSLKSDGGFCGFLTPQAVVVSPAPQLSFDDADDSYRVNCGSRDAALHVVQVRVSSDERERHVLGTVALGDDTMDREVFDIDDHTDAELTINLRTYRRNRLVIEDEIESQSILGSRSLLIDGPGLVPLAIGRLFEKGLFTASNCN